MARGVLAIAMVASAAALLYAGRGQTIQQDALDYAARLATEPFGHALFHTPPNKYLVALPLVLYDGMFNTFGLGADLPYRLVVTALVLLSAGLFYVLARRRVGSLVALAPTILLLFFGSGWEEVITAIRIPSLLAVVTGLGALVVLDRRDLRGDIAAAVLLGASVASHPVGLAFLTAAGVIVVLGGRTQGWRRVWLLAPAVAIFGGWWLFLRTTASAIPPTVGDVLTFATQTWTAMSADVTGLAAVVGHPSFQQVPAKILAGGLAALAIAVVLSRLPRVPPTLWAALAGLILAFASPRLAATGFGFLRLPDDVRYLYPAAVLSLWLLVEVLGVVGPRRPVAWIAFGVLGLGLAYNVARLVDGSGAARSNSEAARGQYAAYELAGGRVDPSYQVVPFSYPAEEYLSAAKAFGSAAGHVDRLGTAPLTTRQWADKALAGSLGVRLRGAQLGSARGWPAARRQAQHLGAIEPDRQVPAPQRGPSKARVAERARESPPVAGEGATSRESRPSAAPGANCPGSRGARPAAR